jgi:restriction system protein
MTVPDYQTLMLPLLRHSAEKGGETHIGALGDEIAAELKLTAEDTAALIPSGGQTLLLNRLHWAKSYMQRAGLIESTRHGYFRVTQRGSELLKEKPGRIDNSLLSQFSEFVEWRKRSASPPSRDSAVERPVNPELDTSSPEDQISAGYRKIQEELATDLLDRIRSAPPVFFEKLIVDLLVAMGYGGGRAEAGKALGRSGDGGVDGVINEDALGLDVVYVQAKRYAAGNTVPVSAIRDFVGSLEGYRASKGVFVTTSSFPASAIDFAQKVSKRVVLIDGNELAKFIIKYKIGVRTKDTYEVNVMDEEYFQSEGYPFLSFAAGNFATLRSAALMRLCQPRPVRRKCATTSGSSRRLTAFLGAFDFGRPRGTGTPPMCQTPRAKSASVNSGASSGSTQVLALATFFFAIGPISIDIYCMYNKHGDQVAPTHTFDVGLLIPGTDVTGYGVSYPLLVRGKCHMSIKFRSILALAIPLIMLAASPARAAIELEPGMWQDSETGEENGQPTKPEVTSDCMTPEEAKDPVKSLSVMKDSGGQCKKLEIKENGNVVTIDMQCGDPKDMSIEMIGRYTFLDRRHYTATMKSTIIHGGQTVTANKAVDSKWTGACKQ